MFGSKQGKQERLEQEMTLLEQKDLSQSALAKAVQVHRSTIMNDLTALEDQGVLLQEDEKGILSLFRKR